MKLTILGKYGPFPAAGGACSGYLVQEGNTSVLLDCGNGVLSRLQEVCDFRKLDAIVLSHLHSDHMSDVMVLKYALDIFAAQGMRNDIPLPIYLPPEPDVEYARIAYKNAFALHPINEDMKFNIGSLNFSFMEMTHPIKSFAIKVSSSQKQIVYSGDTNFNDKLARFAKCADLLIADAGLLEQDKKGIPTHMSAKEVGIVAKEACVNCLVLSHIWPGYDENELLEEALINFKRTEVAQEMAVYEV